VPAGCQSVPPEPPSPDLEKSNWDDPTVGEWPDYAGTTSPYLYDSAAGMFKTAAVLLDEIKVKADAAGEAGAKDAADKRKTRRFAKRTGPTTYEYFADDTGWGLVAVARMQAELGKWGLCEATLRHAQVPPPGSGVSPPYYYGDNLGAAVSNWSEAPAPAPIEEARHYILAIENKLPVPVHGAAIHDALNKVFPELGVKHLLNDANKNPLRWARVVAAHYASLEGNWALCRHELEQCD
jgi:hypothetical protein